MKKKLLGPFLISIFSLFLFLTFIIYYKQYSLSLNEQCNSIAMKELKKVNSAKHSMTSFRLTTKLSQVERMAKAAKGLPSESTLPLADIPVELISHVQYLTFSQASDLSALTSNSSQNSTLYQSLKKKETIFSYNLSAEEDKSIFYFISPYFIDDNTVKAVALNYSNYDFEKLLSIRNYGSNIYSFLMTQEGSLIISEELDDNPNNFYSILEKASFNSDVTHEDIKNMLTSKGSGLFQFSLNEEQFYAYYSTTAINDIILISLASRSVILGDSANILSISNRFTTFVLIIISLFFIAVTFAVYYYSSKNRRTYDTLTLEQARYQLTLSHSKDTLWEYNVKDNCLIKADSTHGIFIGQTVIPDFKNTIMQSGCLCPSDEDTFEQFCDSLITDGVGINCELRTKNKEGNYIWYQLEGSRLYDSEQNIISVIGHATNINEQKLYINKLKEQAGQDSLTKLLNHTTTKSAIDEYINSFDTSKIMAMMIIDLDNFKSINDSLGNVFGDALLIDISAKLKKLFKPNDIIGRVGGDEFIVLLSDVPSLNYIQDMAHYACCLFHDIYIGEKTPFLVSGSIGVSIYPSDGTDFDSLYEKADTALFNAKRKGRDCFCFYSDEMLPIAREYTSLIIQKYAHEISYPHENRSIIDSSIVANVIDILFDSREIDISINMVLSLIGDYYNLGRINIYEYSKDNELISITHEWYSDPDYKFKDDIQNIPKTRLEPYLLFKKSKNGIFYCDDFSQYMPIINPNNNLSHLPPAKSILQCGINDHGRTVGFINIGIYNEVHQWTKNEIDSLSLLCKVIGTYLIRLRSMQAVDLITQKDSLTNTYNFDTFLSVSNLLVQVNPTFNYAIFYMDVQQFKLLNDNYGYLAGDHILKNLADIAREVSGPAGIVSRINGDKFVMLITYENIEELTHKADIIIAKSKQITSELGALYKLNVMIGIYTIAPMDNAIVAVDRANIARKNAQAKHYANYMFFDEEMLSSLVEKKEIIDVMEDALENGEFVVYYQPKMNLNTLQISGAEALVRWNRPSIGIVTPASFVPLFEENGFIVNVDYYVLESVCKYLRRLIDLNLPVYPISVNFSREHFRYDELPERIKETVDHYQIPHNLIEVEITESAFPMYDNYRINLLERIQSYGFRLAMDDFGSGLSSLNLLCDLPFDVIKIDKDFFHSRTTTESERIVILNIVRMALELNMDVICEGVETKEQAQFLQSIGCYMAQGYLYDKPLSETEFEEKYLRMHP